jgi:2-polyprenylphenol 6-hydroxylase
LTTPTQIVVVGGGPVGAAFALRAAVLPRVNVTLIERGAAPAPASHDSGFDPRVYALSPRSMTLLTSLGVAKHFRAERITAVDAMRVWGAPDGKKERASICFQRGESLAHIIEHSTLLDAIYSALAQSGVQIKTGCSVNAIPVVGMRRTVQLSTGEAIDADLVVGADGRQSQIRELAGIDAMVKDYDSVGVVANFACERPHANVASQWFSKDGVLAYLPLPGKHTSIVWSVSTQFASALPTAAEDFADLVARQGQLSLGRLQQVSAREQIALKRVCANTWVAPALALIGDAAHAIHPLAGQGANLGFGDVEALGAVLAEKSAFARIGDVALLRRYERQRMEPTTAMLETTDHLQGLFSRDDRMAKWAASNGFNWFDRSGWIKQLAIEYAVQH